MPSLSLASSPSAVRAMIRVDKATSELLIGPDWTMNMEICDFCNSNHRHAKDVVKQVRRRLHHKNPKVQLLTLTLLETMVKNCGDYIHQHISDRKVLDEMIKIVKKKADIHVRDKILVLLDSWQEAFSSPGGRNSQYYWACDELRRCGIIFPQRPQRSAPIITPPATQPSRVTQFGNDMASSSSRTFNEATSSEVDGLSDSILGSMRNVVELLDDMLRAVNPSDRNAAREEVILDLVDRCHSNQKKLKQILTSISNEELLARGLEMNESLQSVLTKHDVIASGNSIPNLKKTLSIQQRESVDSNLKIGEPREKNGALNDKSSTTVALITTEQGEEKEEEDEFGQLARRHLKASPRSQQSATIEATEDSASSSDCNALVVIDAPTPTPTPTSNTANPKEQDLIDLLSIVLTTSSTSDETTQAPNPALTENTFEASFSNYVVPWAQAQPQQALQCPHHFQTQYPNVQSLLQPQSQQSYNTQSASSYPLPPWEAMTYNYQTLGSTNMNGYPTSPGAMSNSLIPMQGTWASQIYGNSFQKSQYGIPHMASPMQGLQSLQHVNSFQNQAAVKPATIPMHSGAHRSNGMTSLNGSVLVTTAGSSVIPAGQKPYVPSYRLFEDLNVFGSMEGKLKSGPYPSASGNHSRAL